MKKIALKSIVAGYLSISTLLVSAQPKIRLEDFNQKMLLVTNLEEGEAFLKCPPSQNKKPLAFPIKAYRDHLRKALALELNSHLQIGLDSFKAAPLSLQHCQIGQTEPYLQQIGTGVKTTRGYGIEFRVKLD